MASFIVDHCHEGTLTGSAADAVEFRYGTTVTVQNLSDERLRVTVNGTTPTVGGQSSYVVAPSSWRQFPLGVSRTVEIVGPTGGSWDYTADTEPA